MENHFGGVIDGLCTLDIWLQFDWNEISKEILIWNFRPMKLLVASATKSSTWRFSLVKSWLLKIKYHGRCPWNQWVRDSILDQNMPFYIIIDLKYSLLDISLSLKNDFNRAIRSEVLQLRSNLWQATQHQGSQEGVMSS